MIDNAPSDRDTTTRDPLARPAFLSSHRAMAVCTRELARLSEELVTAARTLARESLSEPPVVRQSPDRCIVQLGPVALTVGWLRNGSDSPNVGQLMAIVWHGVIAPRGQHSPERLGMRRVPATPVSVWEETFVVSATSEASWHWHPDNLAREGYESPELAARCIEQLRRAHSAVAQSTAQAAPAPASPDRTAPRDSHPIIQKAR